MKNMKTKIPRISLNQSRTKTFTSFVSDDEKNKIISYAAQASMSVSEYARFRALNYPISSRMDRMTLSELMKRSMENTAQLRAIGNNINQIAKMANRKENIPDMKSMLACIQELSANSNEIQTDIMTALKVKS